MDKKSVKKYCPNEHEMSLKTLDKATNFRGENLEYRAEVYVCTNPECRLEVGDLKQTATIQKTIADAYRKKIGLLTGNEIVQLRKQNNYSQQDLADLTKVGVASIKRWETGAIQTESMDKVLRTHLLLKPKQNEIEKNLELFQDIDQEVWKEISRIQLEEANESEDIPFEQDYEISEQSDLCLAA